VAIGLLALIVGLLTLPTDLPAAGTLAPPPIAVATPAPAAPPPTPAPVASSAAVVAAPSSPATEPASLILRALPRGAIARVDGKAVVSRRLVVQPGRHILELTIVNYAPVLDTVLVGAGQRFVWTPKLVRTAPAKIAGVTKPPQSETRPAPAPVPPRRTNRDEAGCQQQMAAATWADAYQSCVRAARSGSASSARSVGLLFQHGNGVRRNDDSATAWFSVAARGGDAGAMFQLGDAYERGRGVRKDQAAALDWYTRAASAGDAAGQYAVAEAYEKGRLGTAKDRAKALQWYRKAAAQGYKDAALKVHDLGS
jgi:hypothetical protein